MSSSQSFNGNRMDLSIHSICSALPCAALERVAASTQLMRAFLPAWSSANKRRCLSDAERSSRRPAFRRDTLVPMCQKSGLPVCAVARLLCSGLSASMAAFQVLADLSTTSCSSASPFPPFCMAASGRNCRKLR
ncbi:hypothetical protein IE81DRAFT_208452 [Ceraceosorus guamensis]|uniref:Uncharacterized protein n=1 Tax=Ceraceosorus guamensis TaxID=1522189 RepID=A0A316W5I1_9BASI|nr:hypothetical protein IE81DRAFT_208452 [Ceraceosorus guamensis]PWN45216.1 hypothetical protein IE81DRAFT_208452 [Ceraceosorus guamensis]